MNNIPEIQKSQLHFGKVVHWLTILSCIISLLAPPLILLYPGKNLLNPALIFNALFEGKSPVEIWAVAGAVFTPGDFWKLFLGNFFRPDGFATLSITLGCSVTFWGLIPAVYQFIKKKEYFYCCVSLFVMALIALAMSGLINMAG